MKMKFRIFLLSAHALFLSLVLYAQDDKYDAVYLNLVKEYTLNPDGSMDYRYAKELKLQSYRSFHSLYGETFIVYNPSAQKLKFNEVSTVMADGKKIKAPQNAFNEVLPGFAVNAPDYNSLREMVVTHTGLERNSVIHIDYNVHSDKGSFQALSGHEVFAEAEPVKTLIIKIRVPAGRDLYYRVFNAEYTPEKSNEGAWQVYTWNLKDLPALSPEEHQPGGNDLYPRLIFSTEGDPNKAYSFLSSQPAFKFEATEKMKSDVAQWTKELNNDFEIVLKIQDRVVNDFRLVPVPLRYTAYQVRTAEQTWKSNSGTNLEKAIILTALLKTAGYNAMPFSIVHSAQFDEKIGTLTDIEDFGVRVELKEEGVFWLSVTSMNMVSLDASLAGRTLVTIRPGQDIVTFKTETPDFNARLIGVFIVSSDPKLTGEISISLRGSAHPWLGITRDKNKVKNGLSGSLSGSSLTGIKEKSITREALFQTISVQTDKPFRKDSNYYYFNLPSIATGIDSWGIKTLSLKRSTPFELPSLADESHQLTFTLPAGMVLFTPAKKTSLSNKAGSFNFEVKEAGGKVTVKRQLKIGNRIFSPENYEDLKALLDYWNNPRYRELIFTTAK